MSGGNIAKQMGISGHSTMGTMAALAFDPLNVRKLFQKPKPPTMPAVPPPTITSPLAGDLADQGQREEARKRKGMNQAIFASDTGGWQPSSGAPSLFGKASPTQKPLMAKLGGNP